MTEEEITRLANRVGRLCKRREVLLACAESCTGGGLAAAITRVSGSSAWFDRGFVTYSNDAKKEMLGVAQRTLGLHGAVSEAVAREMALGALAHSPGDIGVSVTGIAGPTGGSRAKPVGLVWIAWAVRGGPVQSRAFRFKGGRLEVRRQSVAMALQGLVDLLR
ncbi:MAG: CinA family protein [Usitatibacter sp.]